MFVPYHRLPIPRVSGSVLTCVLDHIEQQISFEAQPTSETIVEVGCALGGGTGEILQVVNRWVPPVL